MDLHLTDDQRLLRDSVREFAERELRPHVMAWDEAQHFPMALLPKLADLGLMGIQFPEAVGGAGMSAVDYCLCIEELARVDPAIALSVAAHNGLAASHIHMFGTAAQQERFLVPLATGQVLGAWGLTEPTAGSDAAGTRTMARRDGSDWILDGAKTFITHGNIAGVMVAMAVTDRARGNRGISAFVIPAGTAGMRAGRKENKLGMRASETSEVIFEACRVPADALLGEEGQGFINTLRAAALKDDGVRTTRESSMAKLYASEVAVRAADECVQIHGGYGFVKDYPAEKYFRDVKLLTIGEGTSEVQRLVIARQLLA